MDAKLQAILAQAMLSQGQTQAHVETNSVLAGKDNVSHKVLSIQHLTTRPRAGETEGQPYFTMALEIDNAKFGEQQKDFNFPVFRDTDTNPYNRLSRLYQKVKDQVKTDNKDATTEDIMEALVITMNKELGGVQGQNLEFDTTKEVNPKTSQPYGEYWPWDRETDKPAFTNAQTGLPATASLMRNFSPAWESRKACWLRVSRGTHWCNNQVDNVGGGTPAPDITGESDPEPPTPPNPPLKPKTP